MGASRVSGPEEFHPSHQVCRISSRRAFEDQSGSRLQLLLSGKGARSDQSVYCCRTGLLCGLTLDEALAFVSKKDAALSKQAEQLSKECAKLKAHIKLVIGGRQELQQIGLEEPRKPP